jgi:hypothetical protein
MELRGMQKDRFADAKTLALFADLKPEDAEKFRNSVGKDFVPELWWTQRGIEEPSPGGVNTSKVWQEWQIALRSAWDSHFPTDYVVALLATYYQLESLHEEFVPIKIPDARPYQKALMVLAVESWRARKCRCDTRFVAEKPNSLFCSRKCYLDFRREYKATYIREMRKRMKTSKKKKKA